MFFRGHPLKVKLTHGNFHSHVHIPCFYCIAQIVLHHSDVFILFWAVLAIQSLCAEPHLIMSLLQGMIMMIVFFESNLG